MKYSKSTNGFFDEAIHGENIPADAVEITAEQHADLMAGQSQGKKISADSKGRPILIEPAPPTPEELAAAVTFARSAAYRDESDPLFFKAQRGEATMDEWTAKIAEIKARFPDGVMPK